MAALEVKILRALRSPILYVWTVLVSLISRWCLYHLLSSSSETNRNNMWEMVRGPACCIWCIAEHSSSGETEAAMPLPQHVPSGLLGARQSTLLLASLGYHQPLLLGGARSKQHSHLTRSNASGLDAAISVIIANGGFVVGWGWVDGCLLLRSIVDWTGFDCQTGKWFMAWLIFHGCMDSGWGMKTRLVQPRKCSITWGLMTADLEQLR